VDDILKRTQGCFREVFDRADLVIGRETTAADVEGWDSLAHIRLIGALELEFKIRFTSHEIMSAENVGALLDVIKKKKGG
jgi:acyl carrier protein